FIHNFGCRVNQAEAFDWSEKLAEAGLRVDKDWRTSEVVVVNTCGLTGRAEADVRQFLRRLQREKPSARVVVTGCLAVKNREEFSQYRNVSSIIPNSAKETLVGEVVRLTAETRQAQERIEPVNYRSRALVKVQDGCNARCTFCLIPYLRGPARSLPMQDVLSQIERAVVRGFEEVVLAGIHLCAYGEDLTPPVTLLRLLQEIVKVPGLGLLRLSSLDPRLLPEDWLEFIAGEEKICPHFHLSLQHASAEVLRKMGRRSRPEEYTAILDHLHRHRPEASLGADIIVGFPGEAEMDYQFLKSFLQQSPLTYFHVFSYSPRPGTPAARWAGVSEKIKKERADELRKISREKSLAFKLRFLNEERPAVVIKKKGAKAEALTDNYIKVSLREASEVEVRQLAKVRIKKVLPSEVTGEVI
ncbi:MAG TPA: tRNA (N(6)-L-threonylcarbamoyladenosine(37)-C(2))-methylthiotransferase MtaB, partial [Candidatus Saccharicenans sp.]|nr:tRNA (N(6)-L-threonylcarbamoyladenosine(37)-C(2))-methylthiotransferase MtaB [Candidatus Saccharicenans sp.]